MRREGAATARRVSARLLLVALTTAIVAAATAPATGAAPPERVRVLIAFRQPPGAADVAAVERAGGQIEHRYQIVPAMAATVPASAVAGLQANPRVAAVEPDGIATALDYRSTHDWGIAHIKADLVHAAGVTGTGVRVAVVDTGVSCQHLELDANCTSGWDFINDDADADDDNGHGTHVGGTIAAERDVGVSTGVVGAAPTATVVGYKVLDSGGSGPWSDIIAAIDHIYNNGARRADVVNMSLGGRSAPDTLKAAMDRAYAGGIALFAAAGNGGNCGGGGDSVSYPARYDSVVAVAAVNQDNQRPCFSSTGDQVELAAPGVSVLSTWPEDMPTSSHNPQPVCENGICHYKYGSGTSMASPHAAAAGALVIAAGVTDVNGENGVADEVRQRLDATAVDLGSAGLDPQYGYGLVDAAAATVTTSPANATPLVTITSPADGSSFSSGETISFNGSASDSEDGDLTASLSWTSNIDGAIGTSGSFSRTLSDGTHTVTASATDSRGATGTASVTITVGSPPADSTAKVDSITYATEGGPQQNRHLVVTVAFVDDQGNPVAGASVKVSVDGPTNTSPSGTTGTDGKVTFKITNAPSGCYTTTVLEVLASGLTWDGVTPANEFCK